MKAQAKAMADFIKTQRKEKNLSQSQMTKIVFPQYTSNQFISNIERGLCQFPVKAISNLSNATGVSKEYIADLMAQDYKTSLLCEVLNESSKLSNQTNN
jgi:transcriptional regulator with XRE-family HTH domain